MRYIKIVILFVFLYVMKESEAEDYVDFYGGVGSLEFLHLGFDYNWGQSRLGASLGSSCGDDDEISITASIACHVYGESRYSQHRPWFFRFGATHWSVSDDTHDWKMLYLTPRLGREFSFCKNVGIRLDAGMNLLVCDNLESENDLIKALEVDDFYPAFSCTVFVNLVDLSFGVE